MIFVERRCWILIFKVGYTGRPVQLRGTLEVLCFTTPLPKCRELSIVPK